MFLEKIYEINNIATQNVNTIKWFENGEEKEYNGVKKDKKVVKDYGLIIKTRNPFSSEKDKTSICLFTGCHTYGTIAAAKYYTNYHIKTIKTFSKEIENLFLLVECDVLDGFPVGIKLIKSYEF